MRVGVRVRMLRRWGWDCDCDCDWDWGYRVFCLDKGRQCGSQLVIVCPCAFREVGEGVSGYQDEDVGGCVRGEEVETLCLVGC